MSETKHTPGPWKVLEDYDGEFCVVMDHGDGGIVATIEPGRWDAGDARLIAAAPELLQALLMQQGACCGVVDVPPCQFCRRSLEVMNRAMGREPAPPTDAAQGALFDLPAAKPPDAIAEGR